MRETLRNLVFNGRICVFVHVCQNVRGLPREASASSKGFFLHERVTIVKHVYASIMWWDMYLNKPISIIRTVTTRFCL